MVEGSIASTLSTLPAILLSSIQHLWPAVTQAAVGPQAPRPEPPLPATPAVAIEDGEIIPGPPVSIASSTAYAPSQVSTFMPSQPATALTQNERKRRG
eukprot:8514233-Prorocentrum_lima.AAC.1